LPVEFASQFIELLNDPDLRASLGRKAYEVSRKMVWWEVGSQYRAIFDRATTLASTPVGRSSLKLAAVIA
jgi:hypothetical protein